MLLISTSVTFTHLSVTFTKDERLHSP